MALMVKDKIIYGSIKEVPSFGFTPVGTVIAVMGNTAPNHYLICNGQEVSIKSYPELALYFNEQFGSINHFGGNGTTTFCVPDLRGEFLRGTGTNSHENQSSGSNVGEHQDANLPNITGKATDIGFGTTTGSFVTTSSSNYRATAGSSGSSKFGQLSIDASKSSSIYTSIDDARPTNTSVLYCIAVHDIYVDARYNYSLEEQVVGRWIDGKPLYQKTISIGDIPTGQTKTVNHNIENMDKTYNIFGTMYAGSTAEFIPSGENTNFRIQVSRSVIILIISGGWSSWGDAYITIQYTKTTD